MKNNQGDIFPYAPQFLKEVCTFDSLPNYLRSKVNKVIKQTPKAKMNFMLRTMDQIIQYNDKLHFEKRNVRANNIGYTIKKIQDPLRLFGEEVYEKNTLDGLINGGLFEKGSIDMTYFVDPKLLPEIDHIVSFMQAINQTAEQIGVKPSIAKKTGNVIKQLDPHFFQSKTLALQLKEITKEFAGTVIVIVDSKHMDKAYHAVKKEFGGKADLNTQFIAYDKAFFANPQSNTYKLYNFLLGMIVKSEIQPWILKDSLHSDCFIGLDVSHIDGKHTSGIVQIIGKDGKIIKQSMLSKSEAGEKISKESMEEIITDCLYTYEEVYGDKPKHITFHRDGRCREDLRQMQTLAEYLGITIDYIEVIKNNNRRIASYEHKVWKTEQGITYMKDDTAYLCATNPRGSVGMAKPIKIVQQTNHLSLEQVVEDIYHLSFMHVHSLNKTRLPISTHYADLSSTFHNKNYIHPSTKHELSLPFV